MLYNISNMAAMLKHPAIRPTPLGDVDMNSITKKCFKCGKIKDIADFHKNKSRKDGHTEICKDCAKTSSNLWYSENKDRAAKRSKEYRSIHKDNLLQRAREWIMNNPDKRKEIANRYYHNHKQLKGRPVANIQRNIEKARERTKQWIKNNPEKRAEQQRNRRALKRGNGGKITAVEWEALKKKYDYTCLCCKRKEPEIILTLDHVIPLKLGGQNIIDNAQPLCFSCNSSKQARYIDYRK